MPLTDLNFNKNMLSPTGFSFNIKKLPEFNFFVQNVQLPGIALGTSDRPTPFKAIPVIGDHVTFGELNVTFKINEDLGNYIELFNWIKGLGFPEDYKQYKDLADKPSYTGDGLYSDAYLLIMSSSMTPVVRVEIEDLFPVNLSDIDMNTQDASIEYITATASFRFTTYKFTSL